MIVRNTRKNLWIIRTKIGEINLIPGRNDLTGVKLKIWEYAKEHSKPTQKLISIAHLVEELPKNVSKATFKPVSEIKSNND